MAHHVNPNPFIVTICDLKTRENAQVRLASDEETIERYAAIYREHGWDALPPIAVDEAVPGTFFIVDGHHRLEAAKRAGLESLKACQQFYDNGIGGPEHVILEAIRHNACHGLDLTHEERIHAAKLLAEHFPQMSLRQIAKETGLSKSTIANLKKEKQVSNLDSDERKSETFPRTHCGNPGCSLACSPEYLSDTDCDWVESDGVWYCSDECREIAREKRLEKQADAILENSATPELTEEDYEEEGLRHYTEEEMDDSAEDEEMQVPAKTGVTWKSHKRCPFCGAIAREAIHDGKYVITCQFRPCSVQPETKGVNTKEEAWELWDTRKGE